MSDKITPCLWFNHDGEEAANFYVSLLPDSRVTRIVRAPVEMSHASYLAWQATKHGMLILWIAGILTVATSAVCGMQSRPARRTSSPSTNQRVTR